jgi:hypothetical protein
MQRNEKTAAAQEANRRAWSYLDAFYRDGFAPALPGSPKPAWQQASIAASAA